VWSNNYLCITFKNLFNVLKKATPIQYEYGIGTLMQMLFLSTYITVFVVVIHQLWLVACGHLLTGGGW